MMFIPRIQTETKMPTCIQSSVRKAEDLANFCDSKEEAAVAIENIKRLATTLPRFWRKRLVAMAEGLRADWRLSN